MIEKIKKMARGRIEPVGAARHEDTTIHYCLHSGFTMANEDSIGEAATMHVIKGTYHVHIHCIERALKIQRLNGR